MAKIKHADSVYEYKWWDSQLLKGSAEKPFAFDLETELIEPYRPLKEGEKYSDVPTSPLHIPKPALGMAFDGEQLVLIHPTQFNRFTTLHRSRHWVGHNIQFDWWVLYNTVDRGTREVLWQLGDNNRFHDSMIMDLLIQLATGEYRHGIKVKAGDDAKLYPTNLEKLASEWECGEIDKKNEYRLRFGELLGKSATEMDAHPEANGFYEYALKDVIATWLVYQKQYAKGFELMLKTGWKPNHKEKTYEIRPDAIDKFGVLSEALQTKASIVLNQLSRTPLRIDQKKRLEKELATRERYQGYLNTLLAIDENLIRRYTSKKRAGEIQLTKKKLPKFNNKVLTELLEKEAVRLNVDIPKSDGKEKRTSISEKVWEHLSDRSEFISAWTKLKKESKLLEFLTVLNAEYVYSRYSLLKRTGRTSASAHKKGKTLLVPSMNVQQLPRDETPERSIRDLVLAPEGQLWFNIDYGYIELRSLAAVCRALFGWSKLAEAVIEHTNGGPIDPHQRTAAAILGVSVEEFLKLPKDQQKKTRQAAKAVNFGRPGGLGDVKFRVYAKASYGVDFTVKEAKEAKKKWLALYPEIELYLGDKTEKAMKWQSGRKIELNWLRKKRLSDFLRSGNKKNFTDGELAEFWELLTYLAEYKEDEQALADIAKQRITHRVINLLCYRACTLTGRVRNNVKYTDGANTPFQGVAADGAKLALWNLMRKGYNVLVFVHDSFAVAIDPRKSKQQTKAVEDIMCRSMEEVLGQGIPVAASGVLDTYWSKE